ncbi:serine carboxypeptidase-like 19 isoform X2 [Phragmites australis]|uniref:serine carboxypeptidase-like 19 isoform X2 n=1 Tax=Phragmites australis TaxID=29695 RepID=UPI002D790241|nr:serine carboxypeptidase-like 19 isoform X2 [Phragmites australis]
MMRMTAGPRRLLQGFGLFCRLCSCCFFFLVIIAVTQHQHHLAFASSGTSSTRVVTSLPGFHGCLPFHLQTGYVVVDEDNDAELFYYFVESESGAADAPFLLWLTGGDRCSVFSGLAYEIGPIRFVLEPYNGTLPRLQYNPNSWTKVSHILFVDSPVGAGFSFSRKPKGYNVADISSSLQLHEFLSKWFNDHPEYLASPFYIGGDSYAGKIVPFLAQMISEGIEAGRRPLLNLKGYLIGNPVTGESVDFSSRVPYAHGVGIISDQLYETILGHCQGEDYTNPATTLCVQALATFNNLISEVDPAQILLDKCVYASPVTNANCRTDGTAGRKILKEEIGVGQLNHPPARPPFGCLTYGYYLSYFWANDRRTRDALGIKKGSMEEWVRCHDGDLPYTKDLRSSIKYHRNLTSRGYRALVYRFTISYSNNMTFATIKGGGHTAPQYEPGRCLAMFSRWMLNQPL